MRNAKRQVYTVGEAAELLGIGRSTAYELVARGELASVKIGGRRFVTRPTNEAIIGHQPPTTAELTSTQVASPTNATHAEPAISSPAPKPTPRRTARVTTLKGPGAGRV